MLGAKPRAYLREGRKTGWKPRAETPRGLRWITVADTLKVGSHRIQSQVLGTERPVLLITNSRSISGSVMYNVSTHFAIFSFFGQGTDADIDTAQVMTDHKASIAGS